MGYEHDGINGLTTGGIGFLLMIIFLLLVVGIADIINKYVNGIAADIFLLLVILLGLWWWYRDVTSG